MNKPQIKLSNVSNLSDARWAAAAGIDYISFCFDPNSSDFIPPIKAKEIIDWVSGPRVIAEFGNNSIQEITDITTLLTIDLIAVNNTLLPDELKELGLDYIKIIDVGILNEEQVNTELSAYKDAYAFELISSSINYDCNFLAQIGSTHHILWALDITVQSVKNIIDSFNVKGICLKGGTEEKPGYKDFDDLADLVEAIQQD